MLEGHVMTAGFPLDKRTIIHCFVGGSQLHGAKVAGYDDLDIYGCYIEPPERILGVMPMEHFVWSSSSNAVQNTANDVDVTMYSLHRWAELMLKGNPAILHYLYSPVSDHGEGVWSKHIRRNRDLFISKKAAHQFLGFAKAQRMRLTGEKGMGRHGQRPDLIEKYGYDTKFAMHYIRLLFECRELLSDHFLTLPRPEGERNFLIGIRNGEYDQEAVFASGVALTWDCEDLLAKSDLPDGINSQFLSMLVARTYWDHWRTVYGGLA